MLKGLVKTAAYARAPMKTYQVLHPVQTARWHMLPFEMRYGYGVRLAAVAGMLVAFPLGMALGLRVGRRTRAEARREAGRSQALRERLERRRAARAARAAAAGRRARRGKLAVDPLEPTPGGPSEAVHPRA